MPEDADNIELYDVRKDPNERVNLVNVLCLKLEIIRTMHIPAGLLPARLSDGTEGPGGDTNVAGDGGGEVQQAHQGGLAWQAGGGEQGEV